MVTHERVCLRMECQCAFIASVCTGRVVATSPVYSSGLPAQFPDIVPFCEALAMRGKTIIVAALDATFQRQVSLAWSLSSKSPMQPAMAHTEYEVWPLLAWFHVATGEYCIKPTLKYKLLEVGIVCLHIDRSPAEAIACILNFFSCVVWGVIVIFIWFMPLTNPRRLERSIKCHIARWAGLYYTICHGTWPMNSIMYVNVHVKWFFHNFIHFFCMHVHVHVRASLAVTCNTCVIDCSFGLYRTQYTPSRLCHSGV